MMVKVDSISVKQKRNYKKKNMYNIRIVIRKKNKLKVLTRGTCYIIVSIRSVFDKYR